jgi:hypothetical protein
MIDSAGEHDVIAGQSEVKRSRLHRSSVIGSNRKFPRTDVLELVIWDETNQYGTFLPKIKIDFKSHNDAAVDASARNRRSLPSKSDLSNLLV